MGELDSSIALDQFSHFFLAAVDAKVGFQSVLGSTRVVSPLWSKIERMKCLTAHTWCLGSSINVGTVTISPWCTRKCQSPCALHRAGGQEGCGHSNPGNGAIFPS
ncbi:hypothetical protein TNCV_2431301 [Trichonephila clavipes]|nr:hypothetical protein TNCV_2431301 [Trichonephila clavipes]